jgi:hypothetical protein
MWPHRLSPSLVGCSIALACALGIIHAGPSGSAQAISPLAAPWGSASDVVRIQASGAKLSGAWVSKTGEQFEVTHADETVEMTFSGPTPSSRKGKISGSFDGAVFAGAYEATDGSSTDRGVVRFLRSPNGTLEGSWRSLVNGRQGTWSLSKK